MAPLTINIKGYHVQCVKTPAALLHYYSIQDCKLRIRFHYLQIRNLILPKWRYYEYVRIIAAYLEFDPYTGKNSPSSLAQSPSCNISKRMTKYLSIKIVRQWTSTYTFSIRVADLLSLVPDPNLDMVLDPVWIDSDWCRILNHFELVQATVGLFTFLKFIWILFRMWDPDPESCFYTR